MLETGYVPVKLISCPRILQTQAPRQLISIFRVQRAFQTLGVLTCHLIGVNDRFLSRMEFEHLGAHCGLAGCGQRGTASPIPDIARSV